MGYTFPHSGRGKVSCLRIPSWRWRVRFREVVCHRRRRSRKRKRRCRWMRTCVRIHRKTIIKRRSATAATTSSTSTRRARIQPRAVQRTSIQKCRWRRLRGTVGAAVTRLLLPVHTGGRAAVGGVAPVPRLQSGESIRV